MKRSHTTRPGPLGGQGGMVRVWVVVFIASVSPNAEGKNMMDQHEHVANTRTAFRDALALFVGRGRRFSAAAVAAATAIDERTINSYLAGRSTPEWVYAVSLMKVLPPEFTDAVLAPAGLGGVRRVDEVEGCGASQMARLAGRMHKLANALADNRIDHRESRDLAPEMRALGVESIEFAAALDAGTVKEQR